MTAPKNEIYLTGQVASLTPRDLEHPVSKQSVQGHVVVLHWFERIGAQAPHEVFYVLLYLPELVEALKVGDWLEIRGSLRARVFEDERGVRRTAWAVEAISEEAARIIPPPEKGAFGKNEAEIQGVHYKLREKTFPRRDGSQGELFASAAKWESPDRSQGQWYEFISFNRGVADTLRDAGEIVARGPLRSRENESAQGKIYQNWNIQLDKAEQLNVISTRDQWQAKRANPTQRTRPNLD